MAGELYKMIVKNGRATMETLGGFFNYLLGIRDVAGNGTVNNGIVDWTVQHRTKTTSEWNIDNTTILLRGQLGIEDTGDGNFRAKIGNGTALWSALGYITGSGGSVSFSDITGLPSDNAALQNALNDKADQTDLDSHVNNTGNPHNTTAAQVGAYTASQTDTFLIAKEPTIAVGTSEQYWRGDKTFQALNTSVVPENTNLYFTNERALAAAPAETAGTIGAIVNGATDYTTPIDADKIGAWDTANNLFKSLTWANLKATLKTYFDSIYQNILDSFATTIASLPATLDITHANKWVRITASGNLTVPLNSSVAYPIGTKIFIRQSGSGAVTLVPAGGVTLNAPGGVLITGSQYDVIRMVKQGTDSWLVEVGAASWYNSVIIPKLNNKYHVVKWFHTNLSAADLSTYFVAAYPTSALGSTSASRRVRTVGSGSVTHVTSGVYINGVVGTSEGIIYQVANVTQGTTANSSTTVTWDAVLSNNKAAFGTPLAYNDGDEIELRLIMPSFATNPTNVMANYDLYFRNN